MNVDNSNLNPLLLDGGPLTLSGVEEVARFARTVQLDEDTKAKVDQTRVTLEEITSGNEPIYGVNTGFGSLSRERIDTESLREVQRNLIRSHAAGVGELLPEETVRAMLLILAASLARGNSGVRSFLIEKILDLLNNGITPVVPSRGSVGASGDLAPLAHAALVLIGEGKATVKGNVLNGEEALSSAGLTPIQLESKEGLALINGTHLMTAIGSLALMDVNRLQSAAIASATLAIDSCRATDAFLDDRIHVARNQPGQREVAKVMRGLIEGSAILIDHLEEDPRVQDPYCLRATPQVLGAAFDSISNIKTVFEQELNAVTDNPLIFPESGDILSGANFHGMPLAIALDTLPIALCHIAGIAERRIYWLLKASDSENPVNIYLSPKPGLHSGLMIAQYTAAACCNEIQTLCAPASVGNISTSAGIEDYNSMGATAAHQARAALNLAIDVIAIELLVMTEAMEYQRPLKSGAGVENTYELVRSVVPRLTEDRPPSPDIKAISELIRNGVFHQIVS